MPFPVRRRDARPTRALAAGVLIALLGWTPSPAAAGGIAAGLWVTSVYPAAPALSRAPAAGPAGHARQGGIASYYWQEQMTASGERFDKRALTAAHRTLPFGTRVKVTNAANGRSVVVRINDRGPFKLGRVIDLSERAAEVIGMTAQGLAPVQIEVVRTE